MEDRELTIRVLLARRERRAAWEHDNLAAPYWRLYANGDPGWSVSLEGVSTPLLPGRMLLIPPETPFAARGDPAGAAVEHTYIHFLASPPFEAARPAIHDLPSPPRDRRALREAVPEWSQGEGYAPIPAPEATRLARLCRILLTALEAAPVGDLRAPVRDPRVRHAMAALTRDWLAPPSVPDLATELGMSVSTFTRAFRKATGMPPRAWLLARRIDYACRLLHHGNETIDAIAARTGFSDRYHLSKVFAKQRGMGPAAFRAAAAPR